MSAAAKKIRVVLVEDSALVRRDLTQWLQTDPQIEVVGSAVDAYGARGKIIELNPDVVLLDFGLPGLDGLSFLKALMRHHPLPVIVVSGLVTPGADLAIAALEAGAFDVFAKPEGEFSIGGVKQVLLEKIHQAARFARPAGAPASDPPPANAPLATVRYDSRQLLLIGASTGGTEAIRDVLTRLPADLPGIAIVQHIPPKFSRSFADRLNQACALQVREATDGDLLRPGLALLAPGDYHMTVERRSGQYRVRLNQGPKVHHQRPAADLLFNSAAACAGRHAVGVLLTGMGRDGAAGLKRLRAAGAWTLAQDEASCVVFGMPRAAQEIGAVEEMVSLTAMPQAILRSLDRIRRATTADENEAGPVAELAGKNS